MIEKSAINLYVNDYSVSLGKKGRKAVEMVFEKAGKDSNSVFVEELVI